MNQIEAKLELEKIFRQKIPKVYNNCTGNINTCKIDECMLCSVRDCPGNEPLHYHHDGCPYCYYNG